MNETKNSIVSSTVKYLNDLQYLAKEDKKTVSDLMLLTICEDVSEWADWYNAPQTEQLIIKKFKKSLIRNNTNIIEEVIRTNEFYKNVSLPQTIYTWQRVYDNIDVNTVDVLNITRI